MQTAVLLLCSAMESKKCFTGFEKELLLELVLKYKEVIENKRTNAVSNRQKKDTWNVIAAEYNSHPGINCKRSSKQLLLCYKNMKFRAKERTKEKLETVRTSSARIPAKVATDGISNRLLSVGGIVTPLKSEFDSNTSYHNCLSVEVVEDEDTSTQHLNAEMFEIVETPSIARKEAFDIKGQAVQPVSPRMVPQRKREQPISLREDPFADYAEERRKMMEHELKMKLLRTQIEVEETALEINKKKLKIYDEILKKVENENVLIQLDAFSCKCK